MKYALLSVSDKTNITTFASLLHDLGYTIISTGGTKKVLDEIDIPTVSVDSVTGFPEMMNGRVKTLHPKIHGGILADRDNAEHVSAMMEYEITPIDLVCVNLYPFERTIQKEGIKDKDAIEQIDIGGPSMLRSAAKNFKDVIVVCDPNDYATIIDKLERDVLDYHYRRKLARKVFDHTSYYDGVIANYLTGEDAPEKLHLEYKLMSELRYGENPHQSAKVYRHLSQPFWLKQSRIIQGKHLSYNNLQDTNAALEMLHEYDAPTAVMVKHMNPCGIASATSIQEAYDKAYKADPVSIFGGIIALNREVDADLATKMTSFFLEIVIAPKFSQEALEILSKKPNLRVLELDLSHYEVEKYRYLSLDGGLLLQENSNQRLTKADLTCVTDRVPAESVLEELLFYWNAVKHVKSNAIVVGINQTTEGIGAGQMNRVGAAKIALNQAKEKGLTSGLYLASDAFFPFADSIELAKEFGVEWIIQPGGSIKDKEVIAACNKYHIGMVFTGVREFKH